MSLQGALLGGFFIKEEATVRQYGLRGSNTDDGDCRQAVLTQGVCCLQGKLSQAPISSFQVPTPAGIVQGSGANAVIRLPAQAGTAEVPGQLYAVSLVPASQGELRIMALSQFQHAVRSPAAAAPALAS
jgi:hypothetical protein